MHAKLFLLARPSRSDTLLPRADFKPLPDNQRATEAIATVLLYILWSARLILCSALIEGHQESGAGRVRMVRVGISQLAQNLVNVFLHRSS
jgi:hypothetical protein